MSHDLLLAQAFKVDAEKGDEKKAKEKDKAKKEPKEVKTEDDLWSEPAKDGEKKGKKGKKPDDDEAVEISPDDIEDVGEEGDEGDEGDEGHKAAGSDDLGGADIERDTWGDEERIENAEALDKGDQKPKPDAGQKKPVTSERPGPDAGLGTKEKVDAGIAASSADDKAKDEFEVTQNLEEIRMPSGTVADLSALWEQRRIHLAQRDFDLAAADLKKFIGLKNELSIRNMFFQANVLIREANVARQAEDMNRALGLIDSAIAVAPDLPSVYLKQAALFFSDSPFKVGRLFGAFSEASSAMFREPLSANRFFVNLVAGLLLGLGLTAALFILVQFLLYLRLFFHDFHHLFPQGVAKLQTGLLAVLVILIPVIFRTGLVTILLVWALIAWIYQQRWERLVTFLAVIFLAVVPFGLNWLVSSMSMPDSLAGDLLAVDRYHAPPKSISRLKSLLEEESDSQVILATLGSYYKRSGELDLAEQYFNRSIKAGPKSEVLHNNLGNVLFLKNDLNNAVKHYDKATKIRPDLAVPYHNLSRAYSRKLDLDKAKEHREQAYRLDSESVRRLIKQAKSGLARDVVVDLEIPKAWLLTNGAKKNGHKQAKTVSYMWSSWGGIGSPDTFPYVGAGIAGFFGLMWFLRRKMFLSAACVRCGRPACRRCNTELPDESVCGQCYHAFRHKEQVDAKSRISKEIQIRHFKLRKERLARFITFILPGVGQLIKERPLRGALFLSVFCCVLVQMLLRDGIMANSISIGTGFDWLKLVPLMIVFLGFYIWAILDAFKSS
jgi:tetratricopeptide (TPR) repeat protein